MRQNVALCSNGLTLYHSTFDKKPIETVVLESVENIVGKGENAGYKHFLIFPQCRQKAAFSGSFKLVWERLCGKELNKL